MLSVPKPDHHEVVQMGPGFLWPPLAELEEDGALGLADHRALTGVREKSGGSWREWKAAQLYNMSISTADAAIQSFHSV